MSHCATDNDTFSVLHQHNTILNIPIDVSICILMKNKSELIKVLRYCVSWSFNF